MRKHKELRAWQDAITLAEQVYGDTDSLRCTERYGLNSQMRCAGVRLGFGPRPKAVSEAIQRAFTPLGGLLKHLKARKAV